MARRVLVVGLGRRGRQWVGEVSRAPDWIVSGTVDPDETTRSGAGRMGMPHYPDIHAALEDEHDAVIIASSAEHHVEPALAAIVAGKPVLIEKPAATSLEDARRVVVAAEKAGVVAMAAQNYRYMRAHRTVKRMIAEGAVGRVGHVVAHYYRTPHDMVPSLRAIDNPILWGVAVHHLDALRHVLGKEALRVMATMSTQPWTQLETGASMRALIDLDDDVRVTFTSSYESRGHEYFGAGQEFYERFVGDEATLHVFHRWLFLCRGRSLPRPIRRGKRPVTEERLLLDQWAEAIESGREPECSMRDNLGTIALLDACLQSAREGHWVEVAR